MRNQAKILNAEVAEKSSVDGLSAISQNHDYGEGW